MINDCIALIMAGGESRRMGRDKATLVLGEHNLLQHVIAVVQPIFAQVLVSVRERRPDILLPQICDAHVNTGPLAGLCAGLERAAQNDIPWVFAIATDMPFIQPALIEQLARRRVGVQAVVPVVNGHPQPLAAFYALSAWPEIHTILSGSGKHSLRALLERLNVCTVDESELRAADPGLRSFFDLDTPQDLTAASGNQESV